MAVTLRRLGLWPATPDEPRSAYSVRFLKWLEAAMFAGGMSVTSFVECLRFRNDNTNDEVCLLPYLSQLSCDILHTDYCLTEKGN